MSCGYPYFYSRGFVNAPITLDAVSKPRMARFAALQNRVAAFVDLAHARQPNEFSVPLSRRLSSQAHIRRIREFASW